ncbi:MAG: YitT family protein [Oscillospiraceae bacterium]|nr:YitT family protein [Oscillospiraceae bacterium]
MKQLNSGKIKNILIDCLYDALGSLLYGIGIICFTAPNHVAPGGVSGIATLVNYVTDLPIGLVNFCINVPLVIIGFIVLGKAFTAKTFKSVIIMSFVLDYVVIHFPLYTGDVLLASLFGGVAMGAGLALVFMRGSTTGGTDILAKLIQLKAPHVPIGRMLLILDCFVLLAAAVVYGNIDASLFGLIAMFASAQVMDNILYGLENGKMVHIVSLKNDEIAKDIIAHLNRSATILKSRGAYSGAETDTIMVVVRKTEYFKLKTLVHSHDPNAFMIVTEAGEIIGEGWKPIDKDN